MSRIEATLKITLKSDLCAGSGDGFSSGIDTDVCYDAQGFPLIPARRIKGCLREAAVLLCDVGRLGAKDVDALFGLPKAGVGDVLGVGSLCIGDAELSDRDSDARAGMQDTLQRYTAVHAQTAVDEVTGSAKANTLRFLRAVNHYRADGSETVFLAPVSLDVELVTKLELVARALRNMGMERNRGYGAVSCALTDLRDVRDAASATAHQATFVQDGEPMCAFSYTVRLDAPIMLPQANATRSALCIPGSSVLGAFAGRAWGLEGFTQDQFDDLFLRGKVRFSPLYPLDESGLRSMPAPSFLVKAKLAHRRDDVRDGQLLNALDLARINADATENRLVAKPLYDSFVGSGWRQVDVKTETVYHHSRQGEGTLYTQNCLSKGQVMAGFIECPADLADVLCQVIGKGELSFGRSKGTQYARCSVGIAVRDFAHRDETISLEAGGVYAAVLDSDVLLPDDAGSYTSSFDALVGAIGAGFACEEMPQWGDWLAHDDGSQMLTSVSHKTISGYNAKWNQKKPQVRAFAAGTTVVFVVPDGVSPHEVPAVCYVGDRQAEGFGRIVLVNVAEARPVESLSQVDAEPKQEIGPVEAARQRVLALAYEASWQPNPSFVGRLALMVRETASREELDVRIDSIKDDEKRREAHRQLDDVMQAAREASSLDDWAVLRECLTLFLDATKYRLKARTQGGDQR